MPKKANFTTMSDCVVILKENYSMVEIFIHFFLSNIATNEVFQSFIRNIDAHAHILIDVIYFVNYHTVSSYHWREYRLLIILKVNIDYIINLYKLNCHSHHDGMKKKNVTNW